MPDSSEVCKTCLKPKSKASGGFVTQFVNVCHCGVSPLSLEQAKSVRICADCKKVINAGRDGSLTQWIFRSDSCKCIRPRTLEPSPETDMQGRASGVSDQLEADEDESLVVSPHTFPCDRYKAIAKLGAGASGTVYLAKDQLLRKRVSVKILHELRPSQVIAFQEEARTTSKLNHPNIIQILDFGPTDSGAPYMVLEYLERMISLQRVLKESGPLPLEIAYPVFSKVCDALAHAHEMAVFHRDIKPSNILFLDTGGEGVEIKLIDFGVAKVKAELGDADSGKSTTAVGTPGYMAPELFENASYDARCEIYSLGCVMFEALTGRRPFAGDTALDTISIQSNTSAPRLSDYLKNDCPKELERLISKCLEKDPSHRISSIAQIKETIGELATQEAADSSERSVDKISSAPVKKIAKISALLCLIGLALLVWKFSFQSEVKTKKPQAKSSTIATTGRKLTAKDHLSSFALEDYSIAGAIPKDKFVYNRITRAWAVTTGISDSDLDKLVAQYGGQIEELELGTHDLPIFDNKITEKGFAKISRLPLRKLHLVGNVITGGDLKEIAKIRSLIDLDLESTRVRDEDLKIIQKLPLRKLSLRNNHTITDLGMTTVASMNRLEDLRLADTNCSDKSLESIRGLKLERLHLGNCAISDQGIAFLENMVTLRRLVLDDTHVSEAGLKKLRGLKLISLDVERCAKFDDSCLELVTASFPQLQTLICSKTPLTGATMKYIPRLKNLNSLEIVGLGLEDKDMEPIFKLSNLSSLDCTSNKITDETVFKLASMPSLKFVNLNDCTSITKRGFEMLREKRIATQYMHQSDLEGVDELFSEFTHE